MTDESRSQAEHDIRKTPPALTTPSDAQNSPREDIKAAPPEPSTLSARRPLFRS